MQNKNTSYIILGVIIVVVIVSYFIPLDSFKPKVTTPSQNTSITPGTPKFIMGVVSKTEGQNVYIKIGGKEKTVIIDDKTIITKQIKEDGKYNNLPANLLEIKDSLRIVVYYLGEESDLEYRAAKIQILNF